MEYRVLGPITAIGDDGTRVALAGPKQRAVLALLLLHRGHVLTTDRIVDGVWGEAATSGSRRSLQTYVSELRGLLDDAIVHDSGGYRLEIGTSSVDAARFEELVEEARTRPASESERVASLLREALGLWRGRPYGEVGDLTALRPEVRRLEHLRLDALEDRIAADLDCGRHMAATEELDALVREHPFRERLWAMRMLAQYRAGRQAHALDTYEQACAVLRSELGLDPGPELRELQTRILQQDPSLDVSGADTDADDVHTARGLEVRDLLTDGGRTKVYRAFQPSMGRIVALRVVPPEVANDRSFVHRFHDVTRKWALLDHPHVLGLLDAWRDPDGAHLVSPFMEDDLARRLDAGALPAPAALRVIDESAQAIAYLHRQGIVHGGLTPASIRLDDDDHARVAGAGLATLLGDPDPQDDLTALGDLTQRLLLRDGAGTTAGDLEEVVSAARAGQYGRVSDFRRDLRRAAGADVVAMAMAVPPSSDRVENPFKGLRPFQEADADDFFGREGLVDDVIDRLERQEFVALVGPSGAGKSSVVRAGVLPVIRSGGVAGSDWLVADLFPGAYPFEELLTALRSVAVQELDVTAADLVRDERALVHAIKQAVPPDEVLLLFVDQLEEIFSHGPRSEESNVFLGALAAAAAEASDRLRILVTLRGDFFEHGLEHPTFAPLLTRATVPVGMPSSAELAAAIARPAHAAGLELEPGLVDEIVADHHEQPGGLPMLQYACTELVERRDGAMLTRAAYRASGGVAGVLERRAEEVFHGLSIAAAGAAEAVFLRLVTVRTDGQDVRRRVHRTELDALHDETTPVEDVVTAFGAARLLTFDRDPVTRSPTVEIAHDALLENWPRLRTWLDSRRDDIVQRQRLQAAVNEWEQADRDRGFLLPEPKLVSYEQWVSGTGMALTPAEREYLETSREAVERDRERERRRQEHERRLERRSVNRTRAVAVISVVGALVATGLSLFAFDERDRAARQQVRAQVQQVRAERGELVASTRELAANAVTQLDEDPELSILLATEAVEMTRRVDGTVLPEAESALREALQSRLQRVFPAGGAQALAPDGTVATLSMDGTLVLWSSDADESRFEVPGQVRAADLRQGRIGVVDDVDFSPDGSTIVVTDGDHLGHVRDVATGEVLVTLDGEVARPQFGPDGEVVAALLLGDSEPGQPAGRTLGIWDATTGELLRRLDGHATNVESHAFSPDGSLLATAAGPDGLRVWDAATGRARWHVEETAYSVALSPDGTRVAMGTQDGRVLLRDVADGTRQQTFSGQDGIVRGVAFGPEGERLAAGTGDGQTQVWDVAQGTEKLVLRGPGLIEEITFTPDGAHLLATTQTDLTRLWDIGLQGSAEYMAIPMPEGPLPRQVRMAPDSPHIAVPGADSLAIWDLDHNEVIRELKTDLPARLVDYSGDGEVLAVAATRGLDGAPDTWSDEVQLWDAATGDRVTTLEGFDGTAWDLALDHDGSTLAHGGIDGVLRVVDTATGEELERYVHDAGTIYRVEFTPDGDRLVVGAQDAGFVLETSTWEVASEFDVERSVLDLDLTDSDSALTVELVTRVVQRDLGTGEAVGSVMPEEGIISVARSGDLLALAGGNDMAVRDLATGDLRFRVRHDVEVHIVRFSADGRYLAFFGSAQGVQVHLVRMDDLLDLARDRVTRSLTPEECERYLHGPCQETGDVLEEAATEPS